ncbi:hypothetical protein A2U01_0103164, partial [Trifolium medium]|nr:hypothetical protein [Trifolium medium]
MNLRKDGDGEKYLPVMEERGWKTDLEAWRRMEKHPPTISGPVDIPSL